MDGSCFVSVPRHFGKLHEFLHKRWSCVIVAFKCREVVIIYTAARSTIAEGRTISITAPDFEQHTIQIITKKSIIQQPSSVIIIGAKTQKSFAFILINSDSLCHFDHCFSNSYTHQREIMQSKKLQKVSVILPSLLFPHPLPNFILRLLDMPKLSLNLIIPLTSVFQPQFLLRRVILARQRVWQENTEHRMCSKSSAQMR